MMLGWFSAEAACASWMKAAAALGIAGAGAGENLDGDKPVEAGVLGLPDFAHASGAELF